MKEFVALAGAHKYFSEIFLPIAKVTLKTAQFSTLKVSAGGNLSLTATVPSINDVDKFIQVFSLPQFYENFTNVRIGSLSRIQDEQGVSYRFEITMSYNPQLITPK